jgi:hypothetical protein
METDIQTDTPRAQSWCVRRVAVNSSKKLRQARIAC